MAVWAHVFPSKISVRNVKFFKVILCRFDKQLFLVGLFNEMMCDVLFLIICVVDKSLNGHLGIENVFISLFTMLVNLIDFVLNSGVLLFNDVLYDLMISFI